MPVYMIGIFNLLYYIPQALTAECADLHSKSLPYSDARRAGGRRVRQSMVSYKALKRGYRSQIRR